MDMEIKITRGTYGFRDSEGRVRPKRAGETCCVPEAEAVRLVKLGVAACISAPAAFADNATLQSIPDEDEPAMDISEPADIPDEEDPEDIVL